MATTVHKRATTSFMVDGGGYPRVIRHGQTFPEDDPIVQSRPQLFETFTEHDERVAEMRAAIQAPRTQQRPVERTTAAPGEARPVSPPKEPKPGDAPEFELVEDGFKCPQCEFTSRSEHGVRIHQRKAHS